ncbi:MAG: hypothetical protein CMJ18_16055, partial [Phycisphaeraceae bacterium]|nr:hypothetical protein [Phycisphaeraceae bacterium]
LDLCGNTVQETAQLRGVIADALGLETEQVIWSTSQTHSSPTLPGSNLPGGSSVTVRGSFDAAYCDAQRRRFMEQCVEAGRAALDSLRPARLRAGRGFCDTMSYNARFPMPTGGVKFSRHHEEGLQSGKFFDPTIGLLVFEDEDGRALGAIFNFCAHPATMINDRYISSDWVGTARSRIEEALSGAPAMFVQGFCGDVNCYHIFGTPAQARNSGHKLGEAAVAALPTLSPSRSEPFDYAFETVEIECRPMYTMDELERALDVRHRFVESLDDDPAATWFDGINLPEQFNVEQKRMTAQMQADYLNAAKRMVEAGDSAPSTHDFTLGVVRLGDAAALIAHGENFTATGMKIRQRSPFVHTLICGDSNGLFGYVGDDAEIDRGGYETDSFWKLPYFGGVRLAPAKGTVDRLVEKSVKMLRKLQRGPEE